MQFPFLPVGVKWKVVKNVHFPLLLINTGLMSIGPLIKKLLQKHRPVSYSKRRRKLALSQRSLTDSSAESELSRLDAHCDGLCGLVLITSSENYEKGGCETWSALRFWRSHCLDFFWASRFGVSAVYRWMCHEYRKLNQPPSLCSVCLTRVHTPAALIRYFEFNTGCQNRPFCKNGNACVNLWHLYIRIWP